MLIFINCLFLMLFFFSFISFCFYIYISVYSYFLFFFPFVLFLVYSIHKISFNVCNSQIIGKKKERKRKSPWWKERRICIHDCSQQKLIRNVVLSDLSLVPIIIESQDHYLIDIMLQLFSCITVIVSIYCANVILVCTPFYDHGCFQ